MKQQENHKFSKPSAAPRNTQKVPKHKVSINKGFTSLLSEIQQVSKEQLPSVCTNLDLYERVDTKTLDIIKSYRVLDLPCLKNMTEEQCVERYLADPFFHKKLEYQFQYLSRAKLRAKNSCVPGVNLNGSPKGENLGKTKSIKFKDVVQQDEKIRLEQKKKYQNVLRKVSSHEYVKVPFNI